ncbi:MAG: oligosaccharide flippase family protein [Actinomycetes bacterium]
MAEVMGDEEKGNARSAAVSRAVSATAGAWIASAVASLVYVAVTSRLFTPSVIGSYSSAMLAEGVVYLALGSGLAVGIQRREELRAGDEAAYVARASLLGLLAAAVLLLIAEPWATLWGNPGAAAFVRGWALVAAVHPLSLVCLGILRRRDEHGKAASALLVAGVGSSALGLIPFVMTHNALWLVASNVLVPVILIVCCAVGGVRVLVLPTLKGGISNGEYVRSSTRLNLTNYVAYNAMAWSVSRFVSSAGLGVYSRAWLMADIPAQGLTAAVTSTLFSGWSTDPDGGEERRFTDTLIVVPAITALLLAAISGMATPLVTVLLGSQWVEATVLLGVLPILLSTLAPQWILVSRLQAMGRFKALAASRVVALAVAAVFLVLVAATQSTVTAAVGAGLVYGAGHAVDLRTAAALGLVKTRSVGHAYLQAALACSGLWALGLLQATDAWRPADAVGYMLLSVLVCVGFAAGLLVLCRGAAGATLEARGVLPEWLPGLFRPSTTRAAR